MVIGFDARVVQFFGGISTYSRELIRAVAQALPEKSVKLFTRASARKVRELQHLFKDAPLEFVPVLPSADMLGQTLKPILWQIQDSILRRKSHTVDILHLTDPECFFEGCSNVAVTIHDLFWTYPDEWVSKDLKARLAPRLNTILQQACAIFTPSQFVRSEVQRHIPADAEKIFVTYEAAAAHFKPQPIDWQALAKFQLSPQTPFVFCLGRATDARKNIVRMVKAFAALPAPLKSRYRFLVFINARANEMAPMQKLAEQHRCDNVHLFGAPSDHELVQLYNAATGLMFVSLAEGFGLPVLEAMQSGCPVLTAYTSALPEVASDAALYANPNDVESISEAMERFLQDRALREDLRRKGFEQTKKFSWKRSAQLTIEGYKAVLSGHKKT
jgi:glycosyltransferase involved in cell wall biosynthesis